MSRGTPEVRLRAASPEDAGTLTALARAAKASWGYPEHWLEAWADQLAFPPEYLREHDVIVAESGGVAVGVAALEAGPEPELTHLWVHPGAQRRGVGRLLVEWVLARARARGWPALRIESDPHAVRFYERMGARRAGRVPAPLPDAPERHLPVLRLPTNPAAPGARSSRRGEPGTR